MEYENRILEINVKTDMLYGSIDLLDGKHIGFWEGIINIKIYTSFVMVYYSDDVEIIPLHQIKKIWWEEK